MVARGCFVDVGVFLEVAMMLLGSCYGDLGDCYAFPVPRDRCVVAMGVLGGCFAVTMGSGRLLYGC